MLDQIMENGTFQPLLVEFISGCCINLTDCGIRIDMVVESDWLLMVSESLVLFAEHQICHESTSHMHHKNMTHFAYIHKGNNKITELRTIYKLWVVGAVISAMLFLIILILLIKWLTKTRWFFLLFSSDEMLINLICYFIVFVLFCYLIIISILFCYLINTSILFFYLVLMKCW
jgi:hypothetical protein